MTLSLPLSTKFIRTKAEASVAWPHRSISPPGVNQRRWYPPRLRDDERALGKIVLHRDIPHRPIRQPPVHDTDGGGVALEHPVGKRVHHILLHCRFLLLFPGWLAKSDATSKLKN